MICSFCGDPAAHPSTGCAYGPRTIACASCVREFWKWALKHVNGKGGRRAKKVPTALSFYEHAGRRPEDVGRDG